MAIRYECDLCGREVPIASQLLPVKIGEKTVAQVCLNCGSTLEKGVQDGKAKLAADKAVAQETVAEEAQGKPAPERQTATEPPAAPTQPQAQPAQPK